MKWNIGVAEVEITPPFATPLAGFGQARTACHQGVHDPLHAGCVVFENGGEAVALVSCEVIGLRAEILRQVRAAVAGRCGLPPGRVVITCTHTHGAPVVGEAFASFLVERLATVIQAAWEDRQPRRLEAGRGSHAEWVGFNRRRLETGFLPVDREVSFLAVVEPTGEMRAVLYHYACHPSILGPGNLQITADWPGTTRKVLRERWGAQATILYLKGTEGDINTGYSAGVSSLGVPIPTRTFATAERVGGVVAQTLLQAWETRWEIVGGPVRFASRQVELRYQPVEELEAARRVVGEREEMLRRVVETACPENQILAARVELAYARFRVAALEEIAAGGQPARSVEQVVFRLGEAGFLSFPGEFFVASGLEIKEAFPLAFPLGVTNDYLGYFPPEDEFALGGYEVACARFAPETASQWVAGGIAQLTALWK